MVGPVISAAHRDRVEAYVELGRKEGARVVTGGARPAHLDRGFYVAPTLLADCTPDMRVVREEIFGPVVVVVPFDDGEEGVAPANDSGYGLIDHVWSGVVARAFRVARRLRAGGVGVNAVGRNMGAPFDGFRKSGVGRDVGSYALHAYSGTQAIVWPGQSCGGAGAERRGKILNLRKTDRPTVTVRRRARRSAMYCKASHVCNLELMKCSGGVGCCIQG